jgi:translation initiation factor 2B subunit (eIF-2B alpha/beta/delta family)
MDPQIVAAIAGIGRDRVSGATAIVLRAAAVLRSVSADREDLERAARELCEIQPSMAGLRTLAAIALRAPDPAAALDAFARRVERAPAAVARLARPLLALRAHGGPVRLVTCSRSAAVEATLLDLARSTRVHVACSESRPAREGRDLARVLAGASVDVELYSDAGIGAAVPGADAVVVGADALGPRAFINKVGTAGLCALATGLGVPVYVLAGREKVVSGPVFDSLRLGEGPPAELAAEESVGRVRNPYFEQVPYQFVTQAVTDSAVLSPVEIADASLPRP